MIESSRRTVSRVIFARVAASLFVKTCSGLKRKRRRSLTMAGLPKSFPKIFMEVFYHPHVKISKLTNTKKESQLGLFFLSKRGIYFSKALRSSSSERSKFFSKDFVGRAGRVFIFVKMKEQGRD